MVRAVLLDKDGTLLDFERTWGPAVLGTLRVLTAGDTDLLSELLAIAGLDAETGRFDRASPFIAGSSADYGPTLARKLGRTADADFLAHLDGLLLRYGIDHLTPIAGAAEVVADLAARGLPLGIATNDAEEPTRTQLDRLGWTPWFPFVAGYDSGHGPKPAPGMVLAFAAHAGLPPTDIALIGDSTHDLHAARAAGARAIAVTTGIADRATLLPHADFVAEDLAEAVAYLGV